jgi:PIN domain nuclease of toxin-antitoxin system
MRELPIELRHALHVFNLPALHKDPFDRLLIAQAQTENLPIVTDDPQFQKYGVTIEW